MFLCETWIGKNETCNLEIPGYQSEHIFGTKSKNTKRGRYSRGIAVYFRNDLKNFVKVIKKSSQGFLWLKIKGELFCFDEDVFFCHVYFPDSKSKMFSRGGEEVDHFEVLERNERKGIYCNMNVAESEFHFLLICLCITI